MGSPYIDVDALVAEAGGDPWAINRSLQAGRPSEIAGLAEAFHQAGICTAEADHAFEQARSRFDVAWNHQNGDHPINDSAEVQRVTTSLGALSPKLPKIAVHLENIAAALAEAQQSAAPQIATLDAQLRELANLIGQAVAMLQKGVDAADANALHALIDTCEGDAVRDTKAALARLLSIRGGYSDCLQKSVDCLHDDGYDGAPLHGVDADGVSPPSDAQQAALAEIRRITDQAVLDQMAKVRAAQGALDRALADLYAHGPGSPEGEAANAALPKLKADLAKALDDLGKIPDYHNIDPASINVGPDGHFTFTYKADGQPVQVVGQLKDGTGEFFDQATGTAYTFSSGKLTGMRTPDPGKVEATPEPLWSAITLALGGPELKAGGQAAWQGLKTLLSRGGMEGLTSDNLLARAASFAETREALAKSAFPSRGPIPDEGGLPVPGTQPGPAPVVEHVPPGDAGATPGEHAPAGPHAPVAPDGAPPPTPHAPPPLLPDHPLFHGYEPVDPGPEFTKPDGSLIYPDDASPTKPYAIPGTVIPDAHLPAGTALSRFGLPGGSYLAPEGTPFAQLSLPPSSAAKPYYEYFVKDPAALPSGFHIEQSQVAPWFKQPGGGTQYRVIGPDGKDAPVDALVESGYLGEVRK
ncbi:TNT domain-containing protein [Mycobacterium sp. Marseille-P9652]|uniref:TNT domain-containing protein n=1 Tax=Mycobacterium sp. Marseille-P9652 TaxID=2654950 RepID=UPI0012E71A2F|nr:TNT domain-containing protein [Mycobacterium sp. Marseille-P9652]